MAELKLTQITDKINAMFDSDERQLVFWYDDKAEYADEIDTIKLENAKLLKTQPGSQIKTKYFLEYEDKETSYLIYAPFPKPELYVNHLADMLFYSKEFSTDKVSLLCADLSVGEDLKPVVARYIKYFGFKEHVERFRNLQIHDYTEENIITGLMTAICSNRTCSFEEVVRTVISADLEKNKYLEKFKNYFLLDDFWSLTEKYFGFKAHEPDLRKFVASLYITYAAVVIHEDMPLQVRDHISNKTGNIIAFLDNMINDPDFSYRSDELSDLVLSEVIKEKFLESFPVESLKDCSLFRDVDRLIIRWITERLENEDKGALLDGISIPALCDKRVKLHFGSNYLNEYSMLETAFEIISFKKYNKLSDLKKISQKYRSDFYRMDKYYRKFYYYYDKTENSSDYKNIKELIENIYTEDYLEIITSDWSEEYVKRDADTNVLKQHEFWNTTVSKIKERVAVIISDVMRYEAGQELYTKLLGDEKCTVTIDAMQTVPDYENYIGMAALLPYTKYELSEEKNMLIDGLPTQSAVQCEKILKKYNQNSICVQFDKIKSMKSNDVKNMVSGKEIICIFHNRIADLCDKPADQNEVSDVCYQGINEIALIIRKLTACNVSRFIVTSAHGFQYRHVNPEKTSLEAGLNYIQGGCSPQEMIMPVLDVKTKKSKVNTTFASIETIMIGNRITNSEFSIDFMQSQAVSDTVKSADYRIYFESHNGERISNEHIYVADSQSENSADRRFRYTFVLKNRLYSKEEKYYLVICNDTDNSELSRKEITIEVSFESDYTI